MALSGKERQRKYRQNHPDKVMRRAENSKAKHVALKAQVLTYYGNGKLACVQCGETRTACLSIDHINGGGTEQRANTKLRSSNAFYRWLVKKGYPKGYQTLCMNCQFIKKAERGEQGKRNASKPILWRGL